MSRSTAARLRRPHETTIRYIRHDPFCLYSNGTIIPIYPCTCGSTKAAYMNVLK